MRTIIPLLILLIATPALAVTITRERADELIARLPKDPWLKSRDAASLAWGESGVIHACLDMYEATGDTKYLHEVVRRGTQMLAHRDDRRGFKDWSRKTHKAWSMAGKFTVAEGSLVDADGRRVISLRSTPYAYNNQTKVEVTVSGDTFTIRVSSPFFKRTETLADLSVDPDSPRYFMRIVNSPSPVPSPPGGEHTGPSLLISARPLYSAFPSLRSAGRRVIRLPKPQSITLKPLHLAYCGYIGIIYNPLVRFAEMVRNDPSLGEFTSAAKWFTRAADESYEEFSDHFRNGPGEGEGYYIFDVRGGAFPWDNLPEPFNYLGMHTSTELALYRLTGKEIYKEHARRMANLFKNRLKLMPNDSYVWCYWYEPVTTGWGRDANVSDHYPELQARPSIEDASHGTLDVELVLSAMHAGIAFGRDDLRRFANTFLKNVYIPGSPKFHARVDGTGTGARYENAGVAGWLSLAEADPAVYDACREVYVTRSKDSFPALARLLKWEKKLGAR